MQQEIIPPVLQLRQSPDEMWHRRSVRIRLAATVVAVTMPALFVSVNLATYLEYCQQKNCDANSQVIVAAMAQNGKGFTTETLQGIYSDPEKYLNQDGSINWEEYFEGQGPRPYEGNAATLISRFVQNLRAVPGNFERQFMLQLYVNDLKLLQAKGETLPEGVDLEYLECLADRLPGASYHCKSGKEN